MKKYWKIIAGCACFCILMAGSVVLYNKLSKEYEPEQNLEIDVSDIDVSDIDVSDAEENVDAGDRDNQEETDGGQSGMENGQSAAANEDGQSEDENKAPDFTVENADGEAVSLSSMEGKPVVLNFWASWCPPCKSEMPDFQKAYETYGEEIQFMMVDLTDGSRETRETAGKFIEEQGFTFPVYYDVNQEGVYAFYVSAVPATYFIDEKGVIVAAGKGMLDEEALEKGISYLISD